MKDPRAPSGIRERDSLGEANWVQSMVKAQRFGYTICRCLCTDVAGEKEILDYAKSFMAFS